MRSVSNRLERLEHEAGAGISEGPSLIILTALGRDEDDMRGVRLSGGQTLLRNADEAAEAFRNRAASWVSGEAGLVKLATAIYDADTGAEVVR